MGEDLVQAANEFGFIEGVFFSWMFVNIIHQGRDETGKGGRLDDFLHRLKV